MRILKENLDGGWRPSLKTSSTRRLITTKGTAGAQTSNSSVFAALSSMLMWMRPGPSGDSEDANVDKGDEKAGANVDDGVLKIEFLHRYNIVWARSRLLRHFNEPENVDLVDDKVAGQISQDLHEYSNALRDYRFFRTEGELLFKTDHSTMDYLAKKFIQLGVDRSQLKSLPPESEQAKSLAGIVDDDCKKIGTRLFGLITKTSSGMTKEERQVKKQVFRARLLAALSGGLALIAPMLIVVLAPPTKATALATTCCSVLAVAISLAIFMNDSQAKDIVACTAAYTAVLMVFVGVGGGT
ncbi:hypothetical protein B0T18DRAFT_166221 [Schizothecium vesticola]|uniref:DUF6594 domain-containing protein n=1 Tax=Schizothecium vesticola TaxID=314040 RepID=A0AA40K6G6_9PEZI|nr:hypothetical protein B0T18DRAFT_166221 [Schizothecium vesticola]